MAVALEQAERKAQVDDVVSKGAAANAPVAGVGAAQKGPVPKPDPSKSAENQDETVLMAMNIYAEARGESDEGKSAVGQVVYNRVNGRQSNGKAVTWWGSSIKGVITKSKQFSWLNNRSSREYKNALNPTETAMWEKSYQIAQMTVSGGGTANISKSNGVVADSYCANTPSWATADKYITKIGHHKFYTQHNLKLSGGGASSSVASADVSASAQEAAVSLDIDAIKSWYKEKGYTRDCIRAIQRAVGFTSQADVDGYIGPNTIRKVAEWQPTKGLTADGKFGTKSAEAAGISLVTTSGKTLYSPQKATPASTETVPDQKEVVKPDDNKPADAVVADNKPADNTSNTAPSGGVAAPANVDTTSLETGAIKAWYAVQGYTEDTIKAIQRAVGFTASKDIDGAVGGDTAKKVMSWQESNGFTPNGRFDDACATKAGVTLNKYSTTEYTASGTNSAKKKDLLGFLPSSTWSDADKAKIEPQMTNVTVRIHDDTGKDNSKRVKVHNKLAANVRAIFEDIYTQMPNFKVVGLGGYEYRKVNNGKKTDSLSNHSWGSAIDINAGMDDKYKPEGNKWTVLSSDRECTNSKLNPFWTGGKPLESGDTEYAMRTRNHPVVKACAAHGFGWGGEYGDYMHFSYFGGS